MSKRKIVDIYVICIITLLGASLSIFLKVNLIATTFLFFIFPSIYLAVREKKSFYKVFVASLSSGLLYLFCFDFLSQINNVVTWGPSVLEYKILDIVSIDTMLWTYFYMFYLFIFYEHFIDSSKSKSSLSFSAKMSFVIGILLVILLTTTHDLYPQILLFPKAYLVLSFIFSCPVILFYFNKFKIIKKVFYSMLYFTPMFLVYEFTALYIGNWSFNGDYIYIFNILGLYLPIEELVFWIILSGAIPALYFEYIFDNSKN